MQTNPDIQKYWEPKAIVPPKPDPALETMNAPQRSAEVIRYSLASLEFWMSPLGQMREYVRLNARLCMILLIPSALVLPLVSWIIYLVAGWIAMLVGLAGKLIVLPIAALIAVVSIKAVICVLRVLFRR
jgi:hypothetical protein